MRNILRELLPGFTEEQREKLSIYYDMLIDWNTRLNLTAITEQREAAQKHFVDSLAALPYIPEHARVADVGTGAGFPGVVLLIARPDIRLTLNDSLNKRLLFLREVLSELGLQAELVHARAEDMGRDPAHRERYDIVTSRAVAALPVLLELTVPLLKVGGTSIAYKGAAAADEAAQANNAAKLLHAELRVEAVAADYGERALILAKKAAPTSAKYPRRAGDPAKKPL